MKVNNTHTNETKQIERQKDTLRCQIWAVFPATALNTIGHLCYPPLNKKKKHTRKMFSFRNGQLCKTKQMKILMKMIVVSSKQKKTNNVKPLYTKNKTDRQKLTHADTEK